MKIERRKTKIIKIGDVSIGGNHPVAIQSMVKIKTSRVEKVAKQIKELEAAGCEIVRLAVKDQDDALALREIKKYSSIPVVADIHFDKNLALTAIESGVDKIRLNPGNIYKKEHVKEVILAAKSAGIPVRVGVNSGSVRGSQDSRQVQRMLKSTVNYIKILESLKFYNIVVSLKASNVLDTIEAYRRISKLIDYPLHLGVTATGSPYNGAIKSSIALGALLLGGIGDTIRVSLTDHPVQEVIAAKNILESLNLRNFGPEIISCPTCGRCEVDLAGIVKKLEEKFSVMRSVPGAKRLRVAVMGCVVNGPGEAREADIGVAFGKKEGLLFKKGKAVRKVSYDKCVQVLLDEVLRES
ncbi:MAG: flavodoxin-dependent (E)-4-hydroxy-3-methylbut-2-enyl-diphosphate synthase [Candidatus Omnitrophica bacterium]|nr:flavodoxin-dependent (E)-4-hydroxy-3-methylbut-2-enyl-diphosphate synthase [Candidatus Omnitrophota bacterium]